METKRLDIYGEGIKSSNKTFGIDLGTTNSCIGIVAEGSTPEIIKLDTGKKTMPSCVMWDGGNNFIVGERAYQKRYKANVVYSVKRIMGSNETVKLVHEGNTKTFTPEEISAEILKGLCKSIEDMYGKVKNVVITVPAYFNNNQIEATRKAGELAGLNVVSTFREPTSAALVYSSVKTSKERENILVYDLGGGTFDVSLVTTKRTECYPELDKIYGFTYDINGEDSNGIVLDVLRKEGDMFLGGDDVDNELYKILEKKLKSQGINTDDFTRATKEYLKLKLESFKKSGIKNYLSVNRLEFNDGTILEDIEAQVNIQDFADATKIIYDRTKVLLDKVLKDVKLDSIVLVGGSTQNELIRSALRNDYAGIRIDHALNPDESVALGAALQAKRLTHGETSIKLFDILPLSIGVLSGDRIERMLYKDQSVPFSFTKLFTTSEDNQVKISVDIYQGNSTIPEECTYLGKLHMDNLPMMPKGKLSIYVTLSVNSDGVLKCTTSVNGMVKEIELVNIIKGNKEGSSEVDERTKKKLIRWRKNIMRSENKEILLKVLESFENGLIEENILVKKMQELI